MLCLLLKPSSKAIDYVDVENNYCDCNAIGYGNLIWEILGNCRHFNNTGRKCVNTMPIKDQKFSRWWQGDAGWLPIEEID